MGVAMLVSLYEMARVLQILPGKLPMAGVIALHVLPLLVFALIHGAMFYGRRGILIFFAICFVVGNVFENLGVATGFPFGRYYFTDAMGPKLFQIPILVGLAYVGMGYLSWTLGRVILGNLRSPLVGTRVITLPLLAAFIMIAWDIANDAIWANIDRLWVWPNGGPYFGVPLTNFPGLYGVYYLIHLSFAIYLRGRSPMANSLPAGYWRWAIIFYALCAAGGIIFVLPKRGTAVVLDATGTPWNVSAMAAVCVLVCIFVMGAFATIAWLRLETSGSNRL
ncbi:MAG: hypothetical protein QOE81_1809 [Verrucomicrobiota bacterium]